MDSKQGCALCCMITSVIGVVLLSFFGLLCMSKSDMIEIPSEQKEGAGKGCFLSAFLYALTFAGCYHTYTKSSASARELRMRETQMMPIGQGSSRAHIS
mmetsp:Transcript_46725/g.111132  ORF Transcript_46725/g.111132 Transcript_46725/m.111132 type:complete len:99 (-) Transcript_46725:152-448(-)